MTQCVVDVMQALTQLSLMGIAIDSLANVPWWQVLGCFCEEADLSLDHGIAVIFCSLLLDIFAF